MIPLPQRPVVNNNHDTPLSIHRIQAAAAAAQLPNEQHDPREGEDDTGRQPKEGISRASA